MIELDYTRFPVLIVDDEQDNLDAFRFVFRKSFALRYAQGGQEALDLLDDLDVAVIVTDHRMPGMSGIEVLRRAVEKRPDAVGVLLTAYTDMPLLLEAINSGAVYRYIQKPWDSKELTLILRQAIGRFHNIRENARLREQLTRYAGYLETEQQDPLEFGDLSTDHPAMRAALHRIEQLAAGKAPVVIVGEPGTEKDMFARALHVSSNREGRPYVQVSCPLASPDVLARELFGWDRGAFDEALSARPGRVELADGGTLVLSEMSEVPSSLAEALEHLAVHQQARRMGSEAQGELRCVDVRIVVTSTQLPESFAPGSAFGERLAQATVAVPPLRDRMSELPRLCDRLVAKFARRHGSPVRRLTPEALSVLLEYRWPGNLRELETVIERAVLVCSGDGIGPAHLGVGALGIASGHGAGTANARTESQGVIDLPGQLDDLERRELCAALERCNGNKAEVARMLGIQRTTLYYRLRRLGIDV